MRRVYRFAAVLAVLMAATAIGPVAPAGSAGFIEMASVDGDGQPLHKVVGSSTSDDGRFIAFIANADGQRNIVLRDRAAGTTIDVWPSFAFAPKVSGDGSTVVFEAGFDRVMAYDVATQTTSQVNLGPANELPLAGSTSRVGGVSDDGRFVVFRYTASNGVNGVFLRDRVANTTEQVSNLNVTLAPTNYGPGPVSNDGNTVAFTAEASVPGNQFRTRQVFYWQRNGTQGGIASVNSANVASNRDNVLDDMTPDGRFIVFDTTAVLAPEDPNTSQRDVYVRDLVAGTTSFVAANFGDDDPRTGSNDSAAVSDDGMKVAFITTAHIAGKWTDATDVVLADRQAGTVELVSIDRNGVPAGASFTPDLSGNARFVSFVSYSRTLVAPFDTSSCVEFEEDEDTGQNIAEYTQCTNAYAVDRAATGAFLPSTGGTVSTASGDVSVQVPNLGTPSTVTIAPVTEPQSVPNGYEILGQQWQIEAPTATWDNPLRLTFVVDASFGVPVSDIAVIRDGVPMVDCIGSTTALPDGSPCVTSRTTNIDGDAVLVVLTPHASVWTLAQIPPPADPEVTFASLCEDTQAAVGQRGIAQSLCAKLAAASASRDRGDGPSADNQLAAYRSEVAAQAGKSLTAAQADDLVGQSTLL